MMVMRGRDVGRQRGFCQMVTICPWPSAQLKVFFSCICRHYDSPIGATRYVTKDATHPQKSFCHKVNAVTGRDELGSLTVVPKTWQAIDYVWHVWHQLVGVAQMPLPYLARGLQKLSRGISVSVVG